MTKQLFKPLCFILMLIILAFTFSACASVRATTITNEDKTIDELVTIELDEVELVRAGYSVVLLKEDIKTRSLVEAENVCKELNVKIEQHMLLDITDETKEILNSYKNGLSVVYADWQNNSFTIGIRFSSIDVYRYYYNITEDQQIQYYMEEHFFYNKIYYYASTKYVAYNELYNRMNEIYSMSYPDLINSESNELTYTYITESRREHSDADFVNKIDNKYYHTWIIDPKNVDKPVIIYYNVANTGNCILVCLAGTLVLTVILVLIGLIVNKTKKLKTIKMT